MFYPPGQILAVYDRFGRLIHGHPHVAKDVLEYVVYEKHLANFYGKWRLHGKIIPEWLSAQRQPSLLTQVIEEDDDQAPSSPPVEEKEESSEAEEDSVSVYDKFGRIINKYKA